MKKRYIKPAVEMQEMQLENVMMAGSNSGSILGEPDELKDGGLGDGKDATAKFHQSVWEEEEE